MRGNKACCLQIRGEIESVGYLLIWEIVGAFGQLGGWQSLEHLLDSIMKGKFSIFLILELWGCKQMNLDVVRGSTRMKDLIPDMLDEMIKEIQSWRRELKEPRLGIPIIDGEDVHGWLIKVEKYFDAGGVCEEELQPGYDPDLLIWVHEEESKLLQGSRKESRLATKEETEGEKGTQEGKSLALEVTRILNFRG